MKTILNNIKLNAWSFILIISIINFPNIISAQASDSTAGKTITQTKFQRLLKKKNTVLLDVRTDLEYNAGHIPGAIQTDVLKVDSFKKQIAKLDKSKTYLLYCKSGKRSSKAKYIMNEMGFNKLKDLKGGFSQWTGAKEIK